MIWLMIIKMDLSIIQPDVIEMRLTTDYKATSYMLILHRKKR